MSPHFKEHAPYPPVPPFEWPTPGQRTWTPPAESFFGSCTGRPNCDIKDGCPVGIPASLARSGYGCDCPCHQEAAKT